MLLYVCLVFGVIAVVLRKILWSPQIPKLLHTPYARPGKFDKKYFKPKCRLLLYLYSRRNIWVIGPWYHLKIIAAKIWLTWKLIKHPRILNVKDKNSDVYKKMGQLAPTEVEIAWEQPRPLKTMTVNFCIRSFG